ncbi:MAG: hypothetical protein A2161_11780 [Candidatus Schekmanbacteria bacterium RBG_13_48_7]|uniref:Uncharacterized protein n=1 Tax=Candidatus Schekmanbacteria bacterium RBG_13_48_7 TaxID=1817878 RepID=A0A1F7RPL6_9BACT|nr:MAG: hypothetical protein A2161_11780 [Candidatus Schekmanbacteria bacterium RBG_13_48_7]
MAKRQMYRFISNPPGYGSWLNLFGLKNFNLNTYYMIQNTPNIIYTRFFGFVKINIMAPIYGCQGKKLKNFLLIIKF